LNVPSKHISGNGQNQRHFRAKKTAKQSQELFLASNCFNNCMTNQTDLEIRQPIFAYPVLSPSATQAAPLGL